MSRVLDLLAIVPSPQSLDYVQKKQQFHLSNLVTEQRHPETWDFSSVVQSDLQSGLRMIAAVDRDIEQKIGHLIAAPGVLDQAVQAVVEAVRSGHKLFFYGCGATGRLAKQMESSIWRPFWRKLRAHSCWARLRDHFRHDIEECCIGEMTGGDRALVSSLEGFEDLQLIGRLQLHDRGIQRGDVVFCVTEGGETSSVIGAVLAAVAQYGVELTDEGCAEARQRLYFVYNNPDEVLRPFTRSVSVIDNPAITKINLATGPQAIAGSTRMQATTIETFVLGIVLEEALARLLGQHLTPSEMESVGFDGAEDLPTRLASFSRIRAGVEAAIPSLARMTALEAGTYRHRRFATYLAKEALITVFIDNTERSPTFRLPPLDKSSDPRRQSWVQVWTEASDSAEAWRNFLGRDFRGLDPRVYGKAFEAEISDPYVRAAALNSLQSAGDDEGAAYDFSFSPSNLEHKPPLPGDMAVAVLLDEEVPELRDPGSAFSRFLALSRERGASIALVISRSIAAPQPMEGEAVVDFAVGSAADPLTLRRQIGLKMLLNAHSTATMALLGKVVGNTMTNVSPSNLKLVGRATFLVQSHVNDVLARVSWAVQAGLQDITFEEANAVLFDAMDYVRSLDTKQTPEVALSIVRVLESFRQGRNVSWEEARQILDLQPLASYLSGQNDSTREQDLG